MASRYGAMNWLVRPVLQSPLHRLFSGSLALLTITGRKSGNQFTFPTMYAQDAEGLVVVAAFAERKSWWKNLREPAEIGLEIARVPRRAMARALLAEDAERGRALRTYLKRFPVAKTLGIREDHASVDDAVLGAEAKGAVVVVIEGA